MKVKSLSNVCHSFGDLSTSFRVITFEEEDVKVEKVAGTCDECDYRDDVDKCLKKSMYNQNDICYGFGNGLTCFKVSSVSNLNFEKINKENDMDKKEFNKKIEDMKIANKGIEQKEFNDAHIKLEVIGMDNTRFNFSVNCKKDSMPYVDLNNYLDFIKGRELKEILVKGNSEAVIHIANSFFVDGQYRLMSSNTFSTTDVTVMKLNRI